jgi:DNA-binding LytR/AlgR family response regulator
MLWWQTRTAAVAILPIIIYVLIKQNLLLKKFRKQADDLEKKLQDKNQSGGAVPIAPPLNASDAIILTGDYQKEKISVRATQLYLISSANNYVKVYIEQNGKVSYSIIRMTMKKAEEALEDYSCFFRCHRAHIINLDKVVHVEGNAQGYRVQISGINDLIPVSRNLNNEFSDRLLAARSNNV